MPLCFYPVLVKHLVVEVYFLNPHLERLKGEHLNYFIKNQEV